MLGRVIGWVSGGKAGNHKTPPARDGTARPTPDAQGTPHALNDAAGAPPDGTPASPVFSSRAVRDAAVVTGVLESLRRYIAGDEGADVLVRKITALSPEQTGFFRLSVAPEHLTQAARVAWDNSSPSASALRRLLLELQEAAARPVAPAATPPASTPPSPLASAVSGGGAGSGAVDAPASPVALRPATPPFAALRPLSRDGTAREGEAARAVPTPTTRVPGALPPRPPVAPPAQQTPAPMAPVGAAPVGIAPVGIASAVPSLADAPIDLPAPRARPAAATGLAARLTPEAAAARRARLQASFSDELP